MERYEWNEDLSIDVAAVNISKFLSYNSRSSGQASCFMLPQSTGDYYNRGKAWLHLGEWAKARLDLTVAIAMGINIINVFRNDYASVPDFEQKNGVKLPADLAAMLTP